jgi:hypothetical protein
MNRLSWTPPLWASKPMTALSATPAGCVVSAWIPPYVSHRVSRQVGLRDWPDPHQESLLGRKSLKSSDYLRFSPTS